MLEIHERDETQFSTLETKDEGVVIFGNNEKEKNIDLGNIQIITFPYIENILLVSWLKPNLLNISSLCDKVFKVFFELSHCIVTNSIDNSIKFIGYRYVNVYLVDLDHLLKDNIQCLVPINTKINESNWIWHRTLGCKHGFNYKISWKRFNK